MTDRHWLRRRQHRRREDRATFDVADVLDLSIDLELPVRWHDEHTVFAVRPHFGDECVAVDPIHNPRHPGALDMD